MPANSNDSSYDLSNTSYTPDTCECLKSLKQPAVSHLPDGGTEAQRR